MQKRPQRESKAGTDSASEPSKPAGTSLPVEKKPSEQAEFSSAKPSVEALRAKLLEATMAGQWRAVEVIAKLVEAAERAEAGNVISLPVKR